MRCFIGEIAELRSRAAIGGIDFNLLAGLGVFERDDADIWQRSLAFVLNMDGDEIMAAAADREGVRKIRRLEIGNEKHNRAPGHDFV